MTRLHPRDPRSSRLLTALLPRVRNLVRYLARGDRDIDDIAQETLVAVIRGLGTFRGEGALEAWVDRVVVRATFAYLRRRRSGAAVAPQLIADLALLGGSPVGPDEYLARRRAIAVLDELPFEQRRAFVLHHVLEMSVPEIAAELGVPLETVRSRLRLARTRLRGLGLEMTSARPAGTGRTPGALKRAQARPVAEERLDPLIDLAATGSSGQRPPTRDAL